MTNRTLCKNHVVLQRMRLACVRIHNTHTQVKPRDEKKKITETLKKIKGQIARDKGRGGEGRGAFRASVRAPDHRTEKSRPSAPAAKSNPASSGNKKKKKKRLRCRLAILRNDFKKNKIKKQTQLDCWGNWKALPHLSPRWCYLWKLCNRDPAGLRLWLFFFFQNLNKQRRGNHWGNLSRPLKWLTIT